MTRVKICGLTQAEDVMHACAAGADAIGLVFYPPSPRAVTVQQAQQLVKAVTPFVTVTALFVNADADEVNAVLTAIPEITLLQFHGDESAEFCRQFACPYIKAVPMKMDTNLQQLADIYYDAQGLLVDTYKPGVAGGSGETFNWEWLPTQLSKPLILAGGLTPDNVEQAVQQVRPYAVDVSGGVELSKGIKDKHKIRQFIQQVGCDLDSHGFN